MFVIEKKLYRYMFISPLVIGQFKLWTFFSLRPTEVSRRKEGVKYEVKLSLKEGEKVTLLPKASLLLFTPPSHQITGGSDCYTQLAPPLFTAEKGHILYG
jgi:hypothetical protein